MFKLKDRYMHLNRKFVVGLAFAISSTYLLLSVDPEPVHACVCFDPDSPSEAFSEATSVFVGKAIQVTNASWINTPETREDVTTRSGINTYEFRVGAVYKGARYETMFVNTWVGGSSCDYWFHLGEEYIVYAYDDDDYGGLWAHICTRTELAWAAQEDFEELSKGSAPEPGTEAPRPNLNIPSSSGQSCNIFAQSATGPTDASLLMVTAGVAWFGFRKRSRRRE